MTDKETVIKSVEYLNWYFTKDNGTADKNAIKAWKVLLREQEPKFVLSMRECETLPNHYERKGFCPKCHQVVEWHLNRAHCGFCGQELKWE